jgi:hypothetical protein
MEITSVNQSLPVLPSFAIVLVLLWGIPLAIWKPFRAYLFALFLPVTLSIPTMTFTRFLGLGAYFNLYDACFIVMLFSVIVELSQDHFVPSFPFLPLVMLGILVLGFAITAEQYGIHYESVRALRWGITLPMHFLAGFIMLRKEKRHSVLLLTLFLGTVLAEGQHLYYVATSPILKAGSQFGQVRSSMFQVARSESWLIAGPYLTGRTFKWPLLQVAVAILLATAVITTQTRTLVVGIMGGLILYWFFFVKLSVSRGRKYLALALATILITVMVSIPTLNLGGVANNFQKRLLGIAEEGAVDPAAIARMEALHIESADWYKGGPITLLFGNGLDYFEQRYHLAEGASNPVAFGHLGYITYLSQLGLLGFWVYAIWLPIATVRRATKIFRRGVSPATHHLAALTGATFLYSIVAFLFSGSFLVTDVISGTLAGFAFAIASRGPAISKDNMTI